MDKKGWIKKIILVLFCTIVVQGVTACGKTEEIPDVAFLGEVEVISREEGSGTRTEFEHLANTNEKGADQLVESTEEMQKLVGSLQNAIGYMAYSALKEEKDIKVLSIDHKSPSEKTIKNNSYPLCRNYHLAYSGDLNQVEKDFMSYLFSAGQEKVEKSCIPVKKKSTFLSDQSKGKITICGSSSVAPLMEELVKDYQSYNPNAEITITVTDSSKGLTAAIRGECDFAMSSRELKDYEKELLNDKVFGKDAIAIIVNKDNPLENLSKKQIKKLYDKTIEQWEEINTK